MLIKHVTNEMLLGESREELKIKRNSYLYTENNFTTKLLCCNAAKKTETIYFYFPFDIPFPFHVR